MYHECTYCYIPLSMLFFPCLAFHSFRISLTFSYLFVLCSVVGLLSNIYRLVVEFIIIYFMHSTQLYLGFTVEFWKSSGSHRLVGYQLHTSVALPFLFNCNRSIGIGISLKSHDIDSGNSAKRSISRIWIILKFPYLF